MPHLAQFRDTYFGRKDPAREIAESQLPSRQKGEPPEDGLLSDPAVHRKKLLWLVKAYGQRDMGNVFGATSIGLWLHV
jgi:hypothetical protein